MRSPILQFFLFILGVSFNLALDTVYKRGRSSKTFLEEGLEFVLGEGVDSVLFFYYLMLLLSEFDSISEE